MINLSGTARMSYSNEQIPSATELWVTSWKRIVRPRFNKVRVILYPWKDNVSQISNTRGSEIDPGSWIVHFSDPGWNLDPARISRVAASEGSCDSHDLALRVCVLYCIRFSYAKNVKTVLFLLWLIAI